MGRFSFNRGVTILGPALVGTIQTVVFLKIMALIDNITGYWKHDENSGTSLTDSTGNNTGTFNGTTGSQWSTTNKIGVSTLVFNGSNNDVSIANDPINGATAFSMQAWIYRTTSTAGTIIGNSTYSTNVRGYELKYIPDNQGVGLNANSIMIRIGTTADNSIWSTPTDSIAINTLYHVIFTHSDGTTPKVYINASDQTLTFWNGGQGSTTPTTSWGSNIAPRWGQSGGAYTAGAFFTGKIDEVSFWTRRLSGAEVTSLYSSGSGLQYPFAVANISFSDILTWGVRVL